MENGKPKTFRIGGAFLRQDEAGNVTRGFKFKTQMDLPAGTIIHFFPEDLNNPDNDPGRPVLAAVIFEAGARKVEGLLEALEERERLWQEQRAKTTPNPQQAAPVQKRPQQQAAAQAAPQRKAGGGFGQRKPISPSQIVEDDETTPY